MCGLRSHRLRSERIYSILRSEPGTLIIPYHEKTRRLKQLYTEPGLDVHEKTRRLKQLYTVLGIDVFYSNRDLIGSKVKCNDDNYTGVYVIRCNDPGCEVFVV